MPPAEPTPRLGPSHTPTVIKCLMLAYVIIAVVASLGTAIFGRWIGAYNPHQLLALSLWGIKQGFVWQFVSYLFIAPQSLSITFAIYVLFCLYILWVAGTMVVDKIKTGPFLRLFFASGIIGGIVSLIAMPAYPPLAYLAGIIPALYGMLTVWMMLYPNMQLLFLAAIPMKAKWLIVALFGISLIANLIGGSYIPLVAYVVAIIVAYCYASIAWNLSGPFAFLRPIDDRLSRLGTSTRRGWDQRKHKRRLKKNRKKAEKEE